ncbi:MAG: hypothetical protein V7603_3516 [Micromonosporaceae bacterium]
MVCPLASVMWTVQPDRVVVPLLVTLTSAWRPPVQPFTTR